MSRGGVGSAPAQVLEHAEPRHHAERAVERAAVRNGIQVRADGERRRLPVAPRKPGPEVAGLVDDDVLDADLGEPVM